MRRSEPLPQRNQPRWRSAKDEGSGEAASQRANTALPTTVEKGGMIDSFMRLEGRIAVILHLRPSHDHVAGDLDKPGTSSASLPG